MNQQQFAALAFKFLSRCTMAPQERQEFAAVESILQRLGAKTLLLGEPQPEPKSATDTPITDESGTAMGEAGPST